MGSQMPSVSHSPVAVPEQWPSIVARAASGKKARRQKEYIVVDYGRMAGVQNKK